MKKTKALFICTTKDTTEHGTHLAFFATQGKTGEESKAFNDATPGGNLTLYIAPGKEAADNFEQGKSYYLTLEEAPEGV